MTRVRIGIFGGASSWTPAAAAQAASLGRALAESGIIAITGATSGLPHAVATEMLRRGGTVLGVSPAKNAAEHLEVYERPLDGCTHIFFTGNGFTGRNYLNVRNCDGAIIIGGEWGTLEELCICAYEGKVAGILEGSGGITDCVREIEHACRRMQNGRLLYGSEPAALLAEVLRAIEADESRIKLQTSLPAAP